MIHEFEAAEFVAALLKDETKDTVTYIRKNLLDQARKIEKDHPDIRINLGESSLVRLGMHCDNVIITSKEVIVHKRNSITTKCLVAYNVPSAEIRRIFKGSRANGTK